MAEDHMYEGDLMKRGGRKRRGKKPSKATQQQIVNVKVKVGDTVQLMKGRPAPHHVGMGDFRLLQGVGARYANPPIVQLPSSYGIYPASKAPMYDDSIRVGGGSQYNANRVDDIANSIEVNPWGIVPDKTPSKRAIPSKDMFADRRVNYDIMSQLPMQSEAPALHQVPVQKQSMRATPSQPSAGYMAMRYPHASLSDVIKAQDELPNLPGGEQAFQDMEREVLSSMGVNPETGSPLPSLSPSPRSGKSASASARGFSRGGSVF